MKWIKRGVNRSSIISHPFSLRNDNHAAKVYQPSPFYWRWEKWNAFWLCAQVVPNGQWGAWWHCFGECTYLFFDLPFHGGKWVWSFWGLCFHGPTFGINTAIWACWNVFTSIALEVDKGCRNTWCVMSSLYVHSLMFYGTVDIQAWGVIVRDINPFSTRIRGQCTAFYLSNDYLPKITNDGDTFFFL